MLLGIMILLLLVISGLVFYANYKSYKDSKTSKNKYLLRSFTTSLLICLISVLIVDFRTMTQASVILFISILTLVVTVVAILNQDDKDGILDQVMSIFEGVVLFVICFGLPIVLFTYTQYFESPLNIVIPSVVSIGYIIFILVFYKMTFANNKDENEYKFNPLLGVIFSVVIVSTVFALLLQTGVRMPDLSLRIPSDLKKQYPDIQTNLVLEEDTTFEIDGEVRVLDYYFNDDYFYLYGLEYGDAITDKGFKVIVYDIEKGEVVNTVDMVDNAPDDGDNTLGWFYNTESFQEVNNELFIMTVNGIFKIEDTTVTKINETSDHYGTLFIHNDKLAFIKSLKSGEQEIFVYLDDEFVSLFTLTENDERELNIYSNTAFIKEDNIWHKLGDVDVAAHSDLYIVHYDIETDDLYLRSSSSDDEDKTTIYRKSIDGTVVENTINYKRLYNYVQNNDQLYGFYTEYFTRDFVLLSFDENLEPISIYMSEDNLKNLKVINGETYLFKYAYNKITRIELSTLVESNPTLALDIYQKFSLIQVITIVTLSLLPLGIWYSKKLVDNDDTDYNFPEYDDEYKFNEIQIEEKKEEFSAAKKNTQTEEKDKNIYKL